MLQRKHNAVRDHIRLQRFIDDPWRKGSCDDLNFGLSWMNTLQGDKYWRQIYNYLVSSYGSSNTFVIDDHGDGEKAPTEKDLDILQSYLPRRTPKDAFLEDGKNKEYVET